MSFIASVRRTVSGVPVCGYLLLLAACGNKGASTPPPPVVEVAAVVQQDTPIYGEWVATLDGFVNAQIQPRVSGYIIRQAYREGSIVLKGDVLFEIDPRPFKAALDQAKAQLAQAKAQLGKASLDVERDKPLAEARAIARGQLDTEIQAKLGAQALVQAAKANVEQARLNMEFTQVTSLVSRIAGIFPNPNNLLRPGSFGRVRASPKTYPGALLIPQKAVIELQGSHQVAVVGDDNKVNIRPVTVGDRVGRLWIVTEGLKPGERVVVEGLLKVRDGTLVNVKAASAETAKAGG